MREHVPLLMTTTSSYYDENNAEDEGHPIELSLPSSLPVSLLEDHALRTPSTWKIMVGVLFPLLVTGGILQLTDLTQHPGKENRSFDQYKPPPLKELYFDAFLDNFDLSSPSTFPLRILVDDSNTTMDGPLVVYTGNEGSIEDFANQTGQVYLLAHSLRGRSAFVEQRYYGRSIPTFNTSFKYLSTEQVLADLVGAILFLKKRYGSSKVVAVGGSYGGMLTAWLQRQHPDMITAAWASSAPLLGFASTLESIQQQTTIYKVIEDDYEQSCAILIGTAFHHMLSNQSHSEIQKILNVCLDNSINSQLPASSIKERAIGWLQNQLSVIASFDYPYDVSFAGRLLPANPTKRVCQELRKTVEHDPSRIGADRILAALEWFVDPNNAPKNDSIHAETCRNLEPSFYSYNPGLIPGPWTYQHCYDLIMAYQVAESSKMFLPCSVFTPNCWSEAQFAEFCASSFGYKPRESKTRAEYFGSDERLFVNQKIVLTNGRLDPWSYAGIGYKARVMSKADALPRNVIWMDGAAHHLDIWWPHPDDPPSVVQAREIAFRMISNWIAEAS
jgi:lysosomal Pro-X carboxypeptidase